MMRLELTRKLAAAGLTPSPRKGADLSRGSMDTGVSWPVAAPISIKLAARTSRAHEEKVIKERGCMLFLGIPPGVVPQLGHDLRPGRDEIDRLADAEFASSPVP